MPDKKKYLGETSLGQLVVNIISRLNNKVDKVSGKGLSTNDYTTTEKNKLSGIESGAQKNTVTGIKGNSESSYRTGDVNITPANIGLGNVNNTSDANKPVSTAQQTAIDTALTEANQYTDSKTSDLASTSSVNTSINTHNTSTSAHNDIRTLITDLTTKLNNFLDVDDTTTDQLSEVLTLIENNKGTLESLTTSKINVSDIVDNLTTSSASKVLSAKQGVAIKTLIDTLQAELDEHTHQIADVSGLQSALDGKAASSHGTHVTYSTTTPVMDGTASAGSASTVARSDHKHPVDTSRASQTSLDSHTSNTTAHITSTERTNWNAAKTHADSAHAPSTAEKNQNAFSNVKVGDATIVADTTTDTLTLIAGSNVTLTPDATNDKITIAAKDTVYTHPSYTAKSSGLYKLTVDNTGHVSATSAVTKSDITALGIPSTNTTYSTGTSSTNGLTKLYTKTGTATDGAMTQSATTTAIESAIDDVSTIAVSTTEPTSENVQLWINPDVEETASIPEVKDSITNNDDTWSSNKISTEIANVNTNLQTQITTNTADIDKLNTKIAKDLSWSPASLMTGNFYNTTIGAYEYLSIPTLSQYQEVEVWAFIGDAETKPFRANRAFSNAITISGFYSTTYYGKISVHIDFDNNRIGLYTYSNNGWKLSDMGIKRVFGMKLV